VRSRRVIASISMLAILVVVAAGCSSSDTETDAAAERSTPPTATSTSPTSPEIESGAHVTATIEDMAIDLSTHTVAAGKVTFEITNNGPSLHEFVVLKTDIAPGELPENPDEPGQVMEEGEGIVPMGENGNIPAGTGANLTLDLKAGTYQIICNLPGHYVAGMYTDLTVTE